MRASNLLKLLLQHGDGQHLDQFVDGVSTKLGIVYLFLFGAAGAVQVLGLGYDIQLVLLFDVGCVLSLVFIGGVLRMAYPELYQKQKNK